MDGLSFTDLIYFLQMVLNNLTSFNNQLQTKMLFSVDAMLSPPDIIVNPPYNELFKHLMQVRVVFPKYYQAITIYLTGHKTCLRI